MKLLAFALFLLGCVQSSAASEFQVEALYEMRMLLTDTRGVLNDWEDNQMSPCYWNNVICQDNKVTEITLSSSGLTGVLSPSIARLITLQQLLLDGNSITGGIPQEFGNLSSLTTLNLGRNNLTGSIPDSLGRLLKLQKLDLSQNLLSGNIPISLTQLASLSDINLAYNNLSGEIPEALIQVAQYNYTGNHWYCGQAISCEVGSARTGGSRNFTRNVILGSIGGIVALLIIGVFFLLWWQRMRYRPEMYIDVSGKRCLKDRSKVNVHLDEALEWGIEGSNSEFTYFGSLQILEATKNFSVENKLGQGGFGPVYKGQFPDGLEIAVKRLASHSGQGFREFKNEVQLIAKLQHRNLVRLLGCCSQGEEKMLIYEYLPNKSLDFFLFEETRSLLNWNKRLMIIDGIAQGLLYLHKYSRLRVIHRDVKASNILLDSEMNPKISDFGLAKMCSSNDTEGNTKRVVGTYGYMAPEYASEGLFSTKSDVFSYGVLILEIITGKRNSGFHQYEDFLNLLGYAWQLWREGRGLELVDASLAAECQNSLEMMRCINIALLCVQENAVDRPSMSDVVAMLSNRSMTLSEPKHPAYFHVRVVTEEASAAAEPCSANEVTISSQRGR